MASQLRPDQLPRGARSTSVHFDDRKECGSQTGGTHWTTGVKQSMTWESQIRLPGVGDTTDHQLTVNTDVGVSPQLYDQLCRELEAPSLEIDGFSSIVPGAASSRCALPPTCTSFDAVLAFASKPTPTVTSISSSDRKQEECVVDLSSLSISNHPAAESPAAESVYDLVARDSWKMGNAWRKWLDMKGKGEQPLKKEQYCGHLDIIQPRHPSLSSTLLMMEAAVFDLKDSRYRLRRGSPFIGFNFEKSRNLINLEFKWRLERRTSPEGQPELWDPETYLGPRGEQWNYRRFHVNVHVKNFVTQDRPSATDMAQLADRLVVRLDQAMTGFLEAHHLILSHISEPRYSPKWNARKKKTQWRYRLTTPHKDYWYLHDGRTRLNDDNFQVSARW